MGDQVDLGKSGARFVKEIGGRNVSITCESSGMRSDAKTNGTHQGGTGGSEDQLRRGEMNIQIEEEEPFLN